MNVKSKETKENSAIELVIEVSAEEFEAAVEKVYRKNRSKIAVPGFRKGHAPRKIIEGMYGSNVFYEDAIEDVYPDAYSQAVEQEGLDPVAYPQIEIVEAGKDGLTFKATVTVMPEYKIGAYKGLPVAKEAVTVTDEDVENELKPYIQRATRLVTVDREAKEGDTVLIDFEGFDNGVAFEGGKGENYPLELGSHSFIPGFEEGLVGAKAGEDKELDVTFPEDYTPELAGKPVVFKVKVHEVKEPQAPVVDDEFAKDVSEFDTLDAFKEDLGKKLKERREHAAEHAFEEAVTDALIGVLEVDLPQAMVDFRADNILREYAQRFESQGIPFQQYLQMTGQTMDAMRLTGGVCDLPILRPCVGMDKEEIVTIARKIGTFETSILPYEDCCTVFTPRHPRLHPLPGEVEAAEALLDVDGLVKAAVEGIERVKIGV